MVPPSAVAFEITTCAPAGRPNGASVHAVTDPDARQTAGQVYKNIQVFKGIPASQLMPTMVFMAQSLNVNCDHCHVTAENAEWPMERDDKKTKRTARRMILMTLAINRQNFRGDLRVSCVTCHNGHPTPARIFPLGPLPPPADEEESGEGTGGDRSAANLPRLDQILQKYVDALGGRQAINGIRSRVLKGTNDQEVRSRRWKSTRKRLTNFC